MIFAGAVQFDTGELVVLLLLLFGVPVLAVTGVITLLTGIARRSRSDGRKGTVAIVVGIVCLSPAILLAARTALEQISWDRRQQDYLDDLGFVPYEPTDRTPDGYRFDLHTNPFREPPYADGYLTSPGYQVIERDGNTVVPPDAGQAMPTCQAASALGFTGAATVSAPGTPACEQVGALADGTGIWSAPPKPGATVVLYTRRGDTLVEVHGTSGIASRAADLGPTVAMLDDLRPVDPATLTR